LESRDPMFVIAVVAHELAAHGSESLDRMMMRLTRSRRERLGSR